MAIITIKLISAEVFDLNSDQCEYPETRLCKAIIAIKAINAEFLDLKDEQCDHL